MLDVLILATILLPIIVAVVELAKKAVNIKKNYVPLIAVVLAVMIAAAAYPFTELNLVMRLWAGLLAGLASTGLFEITKYREGFTKGDK
ncbi:holin [Kurthia gibsonii]|uniref:holin n=1 Tax=Kurthia TaxID=1649 RepID=UPI000EAE5884|nr:MULTISPECIES: holin [Kurthia]RXH52487.1 holin [Kurthia gibsonii]WIL39761.1 holin [Kurthia sp. YJT4]